MDTKKRRVVYLSDDEWRMVLDQAKLNGVTASELVRDCLRRGHLREQIERPTRAESIQRVVQAETAAMAERFNTQPFRGPIPKVRKP